MEPIVKILDATSTDKLSERGLPTLWCSRSDLVQLLLPAESGTNKEGSFVRLATVGTLGYFQTACHGVMLDCTLGATMTEGAPCANVVKFDMGGSLRRLHMQC